MTAYERFPVQKDTGTETHTIQSAAAECDINKIVGKYKRTGELTHISQGIARYGDFTTEADYHQALLNVQEAKEQFMELPAEIRALAHHDPGEFLTFVDDPKNRDQCIELGIIPSPKEERLAAEKEAEKPRAEGGE